MSIITAMVALYMDRNGGMGNATGMIVVAPLHEKLTF